MRLVESKRSWDLFPWGLIMLSTMPLDQLQREKLNPVQAYKIIMIIFNKQIFLIFLFLQCLYAEIFKIKLARKKARDEPSPG